jgi:P pilus assembly chaperone PapD
VKRALLRSFCLATLIAPGALEAQGVLVAPHAVIMEHRIRSGSLTLYNPGDEPAEVALSTFFGYPVTDSTGNFEIRTVDQPAPDYPSAAKWIDAFPKRVLLGPKQRQTVRLLARPPANLPDGEYWARLVISAKGGTVPVSGVSDSSGVRVSLALEIRTIIPLQYRKGKVATGVKTSGLAAAVEHDSLAVRLRLDRTGNAAFLGTLRGALVDSAGKVVTSLSSPLAVYYDMEPRLTAPLPVTGLPAGRYRLRLDVAAQREDLAPELVLATPAIRDSLEVRLP